MNAMNVPTALLLDPSFGMDGRVLLSALDSDFRVIPYGIATAQDAPLLVALSYRRTMTSLSEVGVVKLHNDGGIDERFGDRGFAVHAGPEPTTYNTGAQDPFLLGSGKILLHCTTWQPGESSRPVLARLHGDGSLDTTFGTAGFRTFPVEEHGLIDATVTPLDDGRMLLFGRRSHPIGGKIEGLVMCLLEDGSLDVSFGEDGILTPDFHGGSGDNVHFGARQDENVVLAGANGSYAVVRRFFADGSADTTFGDEGSYTVPSTVNPNTGRVRFAAFVPANGGSFVGVGTEISTEDHLHRERGFITRIDIDGRQDPGFANGTLVLTPDALGTTGLEWLLIDHSRRLIVVGITMDDTIVARRRVVLGRYFASGNLDESFGDLGYGYLDFGIDEPILRGAAVQGWQGVLVSVQAPALGDVKAHILRVLNP